MLSKAPHGCNARCSFAFTNPAQKRLARAAFTLAETLITLAIIGVIAAITIPSVLNHYKKIEAASRLKKFYSTMEQAVRMAEYENGVNAREFIIGENYNAAYSSNYSIKERYELTIEYWNNYLSPYIRTVKIQEGTVTSDGYTSEGALEDSADKRPVIYFDDGSTCAMRPGRAIDLVFDINGPGKPNEYGRNQFVFFIATSVSNSEVPDNLSFSPAYLTIYKTREDALEICKTTPYRCSNLLVAFNGFEFKKDYPYKL